MPSLSNVKCSACGSIHTLSIKEMSALVLFKCLECGEHNLYVSGDVLLLNGDVMDHGTEMDRRSHVIEIFQLWASEYARGVLMDVNRVIDVSADADAWNSDAWDSVPFRKEADVTGGLPAPQAHSSKLRTDAPGITDEDVRDFIDIDLNLIDKKCYFDRFFGPQDN